MSEQKQQILLIDLENCQGHVDSLMNDLEQFSKVIVCYAKTNAKIPLDWLVALSQVIQKGQLEIVKMLQAGKDSADFGLSFLAGRLSVQLTQPSHFVILSDDKALDYVIHLLNTYGHSAIRKSGKTVSCNASSCNKNKSTQASTAKAISVTPLAGAGKTTGVQRQAIYKYCQLLHASSKKGVYPKSRQALAHTIQNAVKDETLAKKIFHYLITSSALKINPDDLVTLNLPKIETLAKMAD